MKYAICNETFEGWDIRDIIRKVAEIGYTGLELAPFTLDTDIRRVPEAKLRDIAETAAKSGIKVVGLHWLLAKTEGFHLTHPDPKVRKATGEYLVALAKANSLLGGGVMVFGSPKQRDVLEGVKPDDAWRWAAETFRSVIDRIAEAGSVICMEPLAPAETNFVQTAAEGAGLVEMVAHPNFRLHLDVKAMASEKTPTPELIRRFAHITGHFHANDANRRGPGFGDTDFVPIFKALKETEYAGWVSVEVFDYKPDPVTIAQQSLEYMRKCEKAASHT
ncbi:MAG TPA: sugar phosphate isomerase/epimerase family protein [Candidatus Brocadiia bacterium]|nr:sugar phosphate isomerase/epimerase family protein [Candidatus Brocadiia bacterium]